MNTSGIFRLLSEWGANSSFPAFQARLVDHAKEGFIGLGLIIVGFALALPFEKKIGWILILAGVAVLAHAAGVF